VCGFYGWTYDYVIGLSQDIFWDFYYCIDIIEAEQNLAQIQVASFPHLKDNNQRQKVERQVRSRALDNRTTVFKTWTPEELAYNDAKESLLNGK
jgi:hypothetical protein